MSYEFPLIVRLMLKSLDSEENQHILLYLLKEGKKSFYEIMNQFKYRQTELEIYLTELLHYGMVYTSYSENELNNQYLYLEISKIGKKFTDMLLNCVKIINKKEEE